MNATTIPELVRAPLPPTRRAQRTVVVWLRASGTDRGRTYRVIPATGRRSDARPAHRYAIGHDQRVEPWAVRDDLTAMLQLGAVNVGPPP